MDGWMSHPRPPARTEVVQRLLEDVGQLDARDCLDPGENGGKTRVKRGGKKGGKQGGKGTGSWSQHRRKYVSLVNFSPPFSLFFFSTASTVLNLEGHATHDIDSSLWRALSHGIVYGASEERRVKLMGKSRVSAMPARPPSARPHPPARPPAHTRR